MHHQGRVHLYTSKAKQRFVVGCLENERTALIGSETLSKMPASIVGHHLQLKEQLSLNGRPFWRYTGLFLPPIPKVRRLRVNSEAHPEFNLAKQMLSSHLRVDFETFAKRGPGVEMNTTLKLHSLVKL